VRTGQADIAREALERRPAVTAIEDSDWAKGQDAQARANASATWSSAKVRLPVLAATARRQGSQLAAKNSANSALPWLTSVNPPVTGNAYPARARFCLAR